jgi:hypothetical protein
MCNCTPPKNPVGKVKRIIKQVRKIWEETTQEKNFTVKPLNSKKRS